MPIQLSRSVQLVDSSVTLPRALRWTSAKPASTSTRASTSIMFDGIMMTTRRRHAAIARRSARSPVSTARTTSEFLLVFLAIAMEISLNAPTFSVLSSQVASSPCSFRAQSLRRWSGKRDSAFGSNASMFGRCFIILRRFAGACVTGEGTNKSARAPLLGEPSTVVGVERPDQRIERPRAGLDATIIIG